MQLTKDGLFLSAPTEEQKIRAPTLAGASGEITAPSRPHHE